MEKPLTDQESQSGQKKPVSTFIAVLEGKCPRCRIGKISKGVFGMERKCPSCAYELNQESGYFLGAMMVGFFATAVLTIPPVIYLKVAGYDDSVVLAYPFIQYLILGPLLMHYAKIIWVHVGYHSANRLDGGGRN